MNRSKPDKSGIYIIKNNINDMVYVGSSSRLKRREQEHFSWLKQGMHANRHLQSFCDKHGIDCLSFEILELVEPDQLIAREQLFIDHYNASGKTRGFNKSPVAGSCFGFKQSEETRRKVSLAGMGRIPSAETRRKMSEAQKGSKRSEEARKRMSEAAKGRRASDATRRKMSAMRKSKPKSEAFKRMVAENNRKRVVSDATKKKMSEASKGNKYCVGRTYSPETLEKLSDAAKARYARQRAANQEPT